MTTLSNTPGILHHTLNRYHRNTMHTYMVEAGLGDIGSPLLLLTLFDVCSTRHRPPSQRELAEALHITPATVAMSLKSLAQAGYIEKMPDLTDQRCKRISITPSGMEAAKTCIQLFDRVEETMRTGMTQEECAKLSRIQLHMLNNLRAVVDEPPLTQERTEHP